LAAGYAISTVLFGTGDTRSEFLKEFQRSCIGGLTAGEITRRAELAASWQNWVFNGVFTFGMAGLLEETLKYLPIAYARRQGTDAQRKPRNRAYIDYALAGALSFGVVEKIAFPYASCEKGNEAWPNLLRTVFERIVIGSTGHLLVACLTALCAIRRDYYGEQLSWLDVVGSAAILHGTFDFVALACSPLEGNVGWVHPTALLTGLVATAAWLVRRHWIALNDRDRKHE
jgi:RsiW-degrading membrane proteinase PrsW (M82 family)